MSKIEWTEETWNPLAGCTKISEGCKNCYAIKDAVRLSGNPNQKIAQKYAGTTKTEHGKMNWTGVVNVASDDVLTQPLRWTRPRKIFVNSMSDLFHEAVSFETIDKIFAVMALCPKHTFQILTKRADRMRDYFARIDRHNEIELAADIIFPKVYGKYILPQLPLQNVWLGVSVENQKAADERIPPLLETPAAVRFLSCEPLLEKLNLPLYYCTNCFKFTKTHLVNSGKDWGCTICGQYKTYGWKPSNVQGIHQVIVGGESGIGDKIRPTNPEWVRDIRDQCCAARVKFFFKQWGNWFPMTEKPPEDSKKWKIGQEKALTHIKIWDDEQKNVSVLIGKHNAGRYLDGKIWNEMPEIKNA